MKEVGLTGIGVLRLMTTNTEVTRKTQANQHLKTTFEEGLVINFCSYNMINQIKILHYL